MERDLNLDDEAQLALSVGLHSAIANGESVCGTDYLLYGLVVTAKADLADLADVFALNPLRVDHAIDRLMEKRLSLGGTGDGSPRLSEEAIVALQTPRLDGDGPTGVFEVMKGAIAHDDSNACIILRDLGIVPDKVRRLVDYGAKHLTPEQVQDLLSSLDRRDEKHRPWWGPSSDDRLSWSKGPTTAIARSESAQATLSGVFVEGDGVGLRLSVTSTSNWLLPPVFIPQESLVPGEGAVYNDGPDFLLVRMDMADGTVIDNRAAGDRFCEAEPERPRIVLLRQKREIISFNDRRLAAKELVIADLWAWPSGPDARFQLSVDWPAESLSGSIALDIAGQVKPTH